MNTSINPRVASPKRNIAGSQMIKDIGVTPDRIRTGPVRYRQLSAIVSFFYNGKKLLKLRHRYCK